MKLLAQGPRLPRAEPSRLALLCTARPAERGEHPLAEVTWPLARPSLRLRCRLRVYLFVTGDFSYLRATRHSLLPPFSARQMRKPPLCVSPNFPAFLLPNLREISENPGCSLPGVGAEARTEQVGSRAVRLLCLPEPREHDLREDVARPAPLLQAEHHPEGARPEAPVPVSSPGPGGAARGGRKPEAGQRLTAGPDPRFLKLPGKPARARGSRPQQRQSREQGQEGFEAEALAVSP